MSLCVIQRKKSRYCATGCRPEVPFLSLDQVPELCGAQGMDL
jgi:hypothetical protein